MVNRDKIEARRTQRDAGRDTDRKKMAARLEMDMLDDRIEASLGTLMEALSICDATLVHNILTDTQKDTARHAALALYIGRDGIDNPLDAALMARSAGLSTHVKEVSDQFARYDDVCACSRRTGSDFNERWESHGKPIHPDRRRW